MADRLLKLREVCARVSRSPSSVRRDILARGFPKPVRIGVRAVAWRESDLDAWLKALPTSLGPEAQP